MYPDPELHIITPCRHPDNANVRWKVYNVRTKQTTLAARVAAVHAHFVQTKDTPVRFFPAYANTPSVILTIGDIQTLELDHQRGKVAIRMDENGPQWAIQQGGGLHIIKSADNVLLDECGSITARYEGRPYSCKHNDPDAGQHDDHSAAELFAQAPFEQH